MTGFHDNRRIGFHLPVTGGVSNALSHARQLGTNAVQVFLKNPNQWIGKPLDPDDISLFKQILDETDIHVVAHTGYLINCAGSGETLDKSVTALADEMKRAEAYGIEALVLHPGSRKDLPRDEAIAQVARVIDTLYAEHRFSATLLLETMAGQGSSLGRSFEDLAEIMNRARHRDKIGICLDTAHIWAAGYGFEDTATLDSFNATLGLDLLKLIHLNDSKKGRGSMVDRHEHLGQGLIGLEGLSSLLNDSRIHDVPVIMETPKSKDDTFDLMNLETVMRIIKRGSVSGAPR